MRIWKFDLEATDRQTIQMPMDARIVAVGAQDPTGHTVQVWAEVDPGAELEARHFDIRGTGRELGSGRRTHLGTVITAGGALVWHVYEVRW